MILRKYAKRVKNLFVLMFLSGVFFAVALFLPSCGDGNTVRLIYDDDMECYVDKENGVNYVFCLGYLRAAEINKPAYATYPLAKKRIKLYEIPGLDPQKWLSEDISEGIPFLFKEIHEEEPTLAEFETVRIHFTEEAEISIAAGLIDMEDDIELIVNDFLYNEPIPFPEYITENYKFYFESEKYPGIYYVLEYYIDDSDRCYLYDRWTDRFVSCSVNVWGRGREEAKET